ncbi:MAG: hypothetical protein CVU81_02965 [Euryarchaeota archaeon HGW-Euryarchaeota-1]|nr:MAG: hypothetical protein CVU81_02965 [Euryarchaeota archaeon HGW-Euryarchaeota-1]
MKQRNYAKIFFILGLICLVAVYFVYLLFVPEKVAIGDLTLDKLNRVVMVEGEATDVVKSKFGREFHDDAFCLCMRNETRAHFTLRGKTGEITVYLRDPDLYVPLSGEKVSV